MSEQVNLFQSVFNTVLHQAQSQQTSHKNTTPYIVLYLVGVALGSVLVLKKYSKR